MTPNDVLRFNYPDWVAMQTRQQGLDGTGEIRFRDLVRESLRMRPSRVIVGEVRAELALDIGLAVPVANRDRITHRYHSQGVRRRA